MMNRREFMEAVINLCNGGEMVNADEMRAFCEKELAQVDHRNLKARERQAQRKAEGDALKEAIKGILSAEPIVVPEIVNAINESGEFEDITPSKIVARMTQLAKDEVVVKEKVNYNGHKLVGYRLA